MGAMSEQVGNNKDSLYYDFIYALTGVFQSPMVRVKLRMLPDGDRQEIKEKIKNAIDRFIE